MDLGGYSLVLFGPAAAFPHGTRDDRQLREGEGILIDGGTTVEGYQSDVTRTSVLGKPTDKLQRAFDTVRKAQDAALAAAVAGKKCGSVDDAAREVITKAGYGPNYKYFAHRLGHGIGLDGHEQPYLVRGNRVILEPSMTFSDEPGIYVPGEYGLRCEDDMAISESGPATPNPRLRPVTLISLGASSPVAAPRVPHARCCAWGSSARVAGSQRFFDLSFLDLPAIPPPAPRPKILPPRTPAQINAQCPPYLGAITVTFGFAGNPPFAKVSNGTNGSSCAVRIKAGTRISAITRNALAR